MAIDIFFLFWNLFYISSALFLVNNYDFYYCKLYAVIGEFSTKCVLGYISRNGSTCRECCKVTDDVRRQNRSPSWGYPPYVPGTSPRLMDLPSVNTIWIELNLNMTPNLRKKRIKFCRNTGKIRFYIIFVKTHYIVYYSVYWKGFKNTILSL